MRRLLAIAANVPADCRAYDITIHEGQIPYFTAEDVSALEKASGCKVCLKMIPISDARGDCYDIAITALFYRDAGDKP